MKRETYYIVEVDKHLFTCPGGMDTSRVEDAHRYTLAQARRVYALLRRFPGLVAPRFPRIIKVTTEHKTIAANN